MSNIQYGVIARMGFGQNTFFSVPDTCHDNRDDALREALRIDHEAASDPNSRYCAVSVFQIDVGTGHMTTLYTRRQIDLASDWVSDKDWEWDESLEDVTMPDPEDLL